MSIPEPSRRSWSLASDLAQEEGSWQREGPTLAPVEDHVETGAGLVRGNKAVNGTVHEMTSWQRSFITTQMDDGESAGFLLLRVVTNARRRPRPPGGLLSWDIRPADRASGKLHVPDQRLDGGLSYQPHEKELRDEAGGNGAQGREAQQQAAKALRLARVLHPLVLGQSHLSLLLQRLHVDRVCQPAGVCEGGRRAQLFNSASVGRLRKES